jgi:hypothetical protein
MTDPQSQMENVLNMNILTPIWIRNATENYPVIAKGIKSGRIQAVSDIPPAINKPALITGSGASLDEIVRYDITQVTIFASLSHATNLVFHNIKPDYISVVDANGDLGRIAKGLNKHLADHTTLITTPTTDPSLFRNWKGRIALVLPHQSNSDFISKILPIMYSEYKQSFFYPFIKPYIVNAGCVVNFSLQVSSHLGYSPLFLLGVDFCFTGDNLSCVRYDTQDPPCPTGREKLDLGRKEIIRDDIKVNKDIRIIYTTTREMKTYKIALLERWYRGLWKLYRLSAQSYLHEVPPVSVVDFNTNLKHLCDYYPYSTEELERATRAFGLRYGFLKEEQTGK